MKKVKIQLISTVMIPAGSLLVALVAIVVPLFMQKSNEHSQEALTKYQVTYLQKQYDYASFMKALSDAYFTPANDKQQLFANENNLTTIYYTLEPYLDGNTRKFVWNNLVQFNSFCTAAYDKRAAGDVTSTADSYLDYRDNFHSLLFPRLFGD